MMRRFLYTYGIESIIRNFYNTNLVKKTQLKNMNKFL